MITIIILCYFYLMEVSNFQSSIVTPVGLKYPLTLTCVGLIWCILLLFLTKDI